LLRRKVHGKERLWFFIFVPGVLLLTLWIDSTILISTNAKFLPLKWLTCSLGGLMRRRDASITDYPIDESERRYRS
jgi:hypothetical protein